ncbi:hypothetical protein C2G38_2162408 [Gigaspora rosea]|uniref:Uncharacterized protein n=1 Tax=Gigaspora rosea TaxID=44941 RepID=A0A397VZL0_9GLOM|nr:hypothetical protein C2G38_2162408 [Gigaspora rosea]
MPCYADTIVRIKYVRRTEREDIKSLVVWAISSYPVERDDCEIEMVLFLPLESQERDSETQAIFERDCFYSVGGKVVPGCYEGNIRPKVFVSYPANTYDHGAATP